MAAAGVGATPPPRAAPQDCLQQNFMKGIDDIGAFLEFFEATAHTAGWLNGHWVIHLRNSLSGQGLLAVSPLSAVEQNDYPTVKATLLSIYHVSVETYRRKVFEPAFNSGHSDAWF